VALAANGQLGLEAVQQASPPFDVVLMNLQMPVLDGFGATQRIRTQWDMHQLPIIAMTANAMAANREACLAAGMNEHIGKPFDLRHLVDKLVEHTGWASHYTQAPTVAVKAVESVTWPASIDVAEAIERMGGNSALYRKSIQTFLVELQGLLPRLSALHVANDTPALLVELHSLKGLAATLGLATLSRCAAQAEKTARLAQGYSQGLLDGLAVEVELVIPTLQNVVQQLGVDPPALAPSAPYAMFRSQLEDLLVALQKSDMSAMDLHSLIRSQAGDHLQEWFEPLDNAMAALEFEAAALACSNMLEAA
jgi:CheY-like chemotaxis protein